jgi:flagellar basal-body rod protein FlgF
MIRGLYSAATALDAAAANQELIADNLANIATPGFRRHGLVFEVLQDTAAATSTATARPAPPSARAPVPMNVPAGTLSVADTAAGTRAAGQYTNFAPGPMQPTGNPFDLAIAGDDGAFFVLDSPGGQVYTRNGVFQLTASGQLQSASGMTLRGAGGRIAVPQGTQNVTFGRDGTLYGDGVIIGQLQIAQFPQPGNVLQRVGTTLFSGPNVRQQSQTSPTFRIEQGFRENSNVQTVNEMVSMITGMRHYEAAERALRALGEAVGQNTRPQ